MLRIAVVERLGGRKIAIPDLRHFTAGRPVPSRPSAMWLAVMVAWVVAGMVAAGAVLRHKDV
jgi:hypothetical protein